MPKTNLSRLCAAVILSGTLMSCARAEPSRTEFVLGTLCSITLYEEAKAKVYADIFGRLREIENRMSVNIEGSDVRRINAAAGIEPVRVHPDVFEVIERAVHFAGISDGAFDPSVGPLVSLWGIGSDNPRVPPRAEIDAARDLVAWREIELDPEQKSVFLKKPGMKLDLGAIAKGYAADEAMAIIKKAGIKRAIADLGGNILTIGTKRDKSPWKVGIQNPLDDRGAYAGILQTGERAVVTSGVYERFFEEEGIKYHHIFSAATGYPARNGLLSVTISAEKSIDADALSTAVFVMGYEKGRSLVESLAGVEAVFIFEDKSVIKTKGADFTLADEGFRLLPD